MSKTYSAGLGRLHQLHHQPHRRTLSEIDEGRDHQIVPDDSLGFVHGAFRCSHRRWPHQRRDFLPKQVAGSKQEKYEHERL